MRMLNSAVRAGVEVSPLGMAVSDNYAFYTHCVGGILLVYSSRQRLASSVMVLAFLYSLFRDGVLFAGSHCWVVVVLSINSKVEQL